MFHVEGTTRKGNNPWRLWKANQERAPPRPAHTVSAPGHHSSHPWETLPRRGLAGRRDSPTALPASSPLPASHPDCNPPVTNARDTGSSRQWDRASRVPQRRPPAINTPPSKGPFLQFPILPGGCILRWRDCACSIPSQQHRRARIDAPRPGLRGLRGVPPGLIASSAHAVGWEGEIDFPPSQARPALVCPPSRLVLAAIYIRVHI